MVSRAQQCLTGPCGIDVLHTARQELHLCELMRADGGRMCELASSARAQKMRSQNLLLGQRQRILQGIRTSAHFRLECLLKHILPLKTKLNSMV
jgi:hypothetical protein